MKCGICNKDMGSAFGICKECSIKKYNREHIQTKTEKMMKKKKPKFRNTDVELKRSQQIRLPKTGRKK